MNEKTIEKLAREGNVVIAVGGGGVPVYIDEKNDVRPAEAVIDKDAATSLLGARINADEFYVLTDVPFVYINYKKENEEKKEFLSIADAEKYMKEGQFAKGSMGPKIQAGIDFVKNGGKKSVITESTKLEDRSFGTKITMEYGD
jgi:carbamate kinase